MIIAVIPIPNLVSFPGSITPLHIFEPRYRSMIQSCIESNIWLGVAHTKRVIKDHSERSLDLKESLSSNQSTYEPCDILGAGPVQLVDTLPDGRLLVEVMIKRRVRILRSVQEIPFLMTEVEELTDITTGMAEDEVFFRQKIEMALQAILGDRLGQQNGEDFDSESHSATNFIAAFMDQPEWKVLSLGEVTLKIFGFIRLDPEFMQSVLEEQTSIGRAQMILDHFGVVYSN